jgi:NADP-dependent 3-hydroxy acid dehydrogenase YdfG
LAKAKVLITGASSGIGAATAEAFAAQGAQLILLARRQEKLAEVAEKCRALGATKVRTAKLDVGQVTEVEDYFKTHHAELRDLTHLINNAGLALERQALQDSAWADIQQMLDTNLRGLVQVTRLALPHLIENSGHVVNIGSVTGIWMYAGGAVYGATKAAVRLFSEGLRLDLMGHKVRVTNIEPGMVESDFSLVRFKGDAPKAAQVYAGVEALQPQDIAEAILWSCNRPAHVNVHEMILMPQAQAGALFFDRK